MAGVLSLVIDYRTLEGAARGARFAEQRMIGNFTLAKAATAVLLTALKAEAPVRTGRLRESIVERSGGFGTQRGLWGLFYGRLLIDGTRPHTIRPRNVKALRFTANGAIVYASLVHHPGTRPDRFDQRAVDRATPALRLLLLENGRQLLQLMRYSATV